MVPRVKLDASNETEVVHFEGFDEQIRVGHVTWKAFQMVATHKPVATR